MRYGRGDRLPDPAWKSGPTYPDPTADDHEWSEEPIGIDFDGVGRDEAERLDGEPLIVIQEAFSCWRDDCDARLTRRHVYKLEDCDAAAIAHAFAEEAPVGLGPDETVEFLASRATIVDADVEQLYIGFETPDGSTVDYVAPAFTTQSSDPGPCYGHVEPSYEPYGL